MRRELSILIRKIGVTALFVTHDQAEALSIADRVAVMNEGRIVQEGTPADIYDRPRNRFVARFLGAANVLSGSIEDRDGAGKARIVLDGGDRLLLDTDCAPGEAVDVVLRPENLAVSVAAAAERMNSLQGRVESLLFQGGHIEYEIEVTGGARLRVHGRAPALADRDRAVHILVDTARAMVFRRTVDT
jgi:ABC-type Fe3+/spermidine/putrescine transport system ATPase subunit